MRFEVSHNRIEIIVGLLVVVVVACLVYFAVDKWNVLDSTGYIVYADFASVSGLHVGDPIEIAGVEVGVVESISLFDYQARVALGIQEKARIRQDAVASIKIEGLMGDRLVSVDAGASDKLLGPGDEIEQTQSPRDLQFLLGQRIAGDLL